MINPVNDMPVYGTHVCLSEQMQRRENNVQSFEKLRQVIPASIPPFESAFFQYYVLGGD